MSDLRALIPKAKRPFLADSRMIAPEDPKQRKLMLGSLCLLLFALGIVLWHNRDFWFPEAPPESETDQSVQTLPVAKVAPVQGQLAPERKVSSKARPKHDVASTAQPSAAPDTTPPVATATTARTVLPPLEVEVIAGDSRRTIRPGSSSVRVDLQPGTLPQSDVEATSTVDNETAANVTSNAAEQVQISANASEIVARPVRPNYPLLARQMKVQGSVILQALIGKDGIIQNLRVVSGPPILASAAEAAVRQWHFKPHFEGDEAVETQAKITVNFTISTN
jgi:TonB family protein